MPRREDDTWIGGVNGEFDTTLWTVVLKARDAASPERRTALQKLIETYWKPLYHFVRRKGNDSEASKDAVQSFFAAVLEKDLLQYLQPGRARFRTFLMLALKHHLSDGWDRSTAMKRGGPSKTVTLDFSSAEHEFATPVSRDDTPEQAFRREWGTRVLEQALETLANEFSAADRQREFEALRHHLVIAPDEKRSYAEVAAALNLTEGDIKNRLHRARLRFRDLVVAVIRTYTETAADAQDELRDLFDAVS